MKQAGDLARWTAIGLILTALICGVLRLYLTGQFPPDLGTVDTVSPFYGLPYDKQMTIRALLTIPVGILALVIIRQFIGIQTLGTFMPVLIGVAFRVTGPLHGVLLFLAILAVGIVFRALFGRLRLLLIPRLASVLIVIVCAMLIIGWGGSSLNLDLGSSAALFPLVILAMTIERMVITWEESGSKTALSHLGGSLFVALLSYFCMSFYLVEQYMFAFPELLLVLLALTIMMGRYLGFRLTEYLRFRDLGQPK